MSTVAVSCPFEDCPYFGKIEYVELKRFRRHLAQDHDRNDLFQLAFKLGIIQDSLRFHNHSYIIQQVAEISKISWGVHNGSN